MMRLEARLPPHAYLSSGLPGASVSIVRFLFLAFNVLLSEFIERQMVFLPLCAASSYPLSHLLLAPGAAMRADSSCHKMGIFVLTLQPPQTSQVQQAGCTA